MNEALEEREAQLRAAYAASADMDVKLADLRKFAADEKHALAIEYDQKLRAALKAAGEEAGAREAELNAGISALRCELTERERLLAAEREKLVDELAKATEEGRVRTGERVDAVRAEYETRLAELEAAAEGRTAELKELVAQKEAALELAAAQRSEAEKAIKAGFEREKAGWLDEKAEISAAAQRHAAELASGLAARTAELTGDFKARKEQLEVEMRSRAAAISIEAASKIDFERKNWHAERERFENLMTEASVNFRNAQKEIEGLNSALRQAAEDNAARETRFNRELMEAKANYDKELSFRVSDAVAVQTTHLMEALEAAKTKNSQLADTVLERENSLRSLRAETEEISRECEERLRLSDSEALSARRAELEKVYAQKQARLEESIAALKRGIEADYQVRRQELAEGIGLKDERLAAENLALKEDLSKLRAAQEEAEQRAAGLFEEMVAAGKAAQIEKISLQRAHSGELNRAVAEAVARVSEGAEEKHRLTRQELLKLQNSEKEEFRLLEENFTAEKERLAAELARRDKYIEAADAKIRNMERDIMKSRQDASGELLKQIAEQDERFREVVREEKNHRVTREAEFERELAQARGSFEARVRQLEDLLTAKEKLMEDGDRFYRQKQLELDGMHGEFNQRVNKFNEELFAQKQAVGEKEKAVNDYRLKLEKEYAAKAAETEKMKGELSRVILEYKARKQ